MSVGHAVALTDSFPKDCDAAGLGEGEMDAIVDQLALDPRGGDVIRDSGGARKVRVAGRGKGKSGGYRLIAAYVGEEAPVYALALYGKGEQANLSGAEVKALKQELSAVKKYWRDRKA